MAGLIYIGVAWLCGYYLLRDGLPRLWRVNTEKSLFTSGKASFDSWLVILPASFLVGILAVTWAIYLLACLLRRMESPLLWANVIVLGLITLGLVGQNAAGAKKEACIKRDKTNAGRDHCFLGGGTERN